MNAVSVRGLDRRFGPTAVLRSLDLEVEAGGHVTITGPNGAGKSTLMRVLAGLLTPNAGTVEILGDSTNTLDTRRRIGVIGHSPSLYPRMSARENLRFWSRMYDSRIDRTSELLAALALDPDDRRPVSEYSQGMRQRVGVARALVHAPDLVLADEPFAALDEAGADAVASLLASAPTVIVATHNRQASDPNVHLTLRNGRLG